jgi:hypothetical protein
MPGWTTYDAAFYKINLPDTVPATIADRPYTSPIWIYALIRYESWLSGIWAASGIAWQKSFAASIEDGAAQVDGNVDTLAQLAATLVIFEIGFEIMPGTAGLAGKIDLNP